MVGLGLPISRRCLLTWPGCIVIFCVGSSGFGADVFMQRRDAVSRQDVGKGLDEKSASINLVWVFSGKKIHSRPSCSSA